MGNNTIDEFIRNLRGLFEPTHSQKESNLDYLDLGEINECDAETLLNARTVFPAENPVYFAFLKIISSMKKSEILHARLAINEFLLQYLIHTDNCGQDYSSRTFLEHLYFVVLYFTQDRFPYQHYFYEYLIKCYHPVCSFLLSGQKEEEIEVFMEHIAAVGKIAAQKQMDTSSIQHLLRNIETYADSKQLKDLAAKAKDSRYNLEI